MEFRFEYALGKGRAAVWKAFDKPENLPKWQPTLASFEGVSGTPGQPGAVSKLTYKEGKQTIVMTETITLRREPEEFSGIYDSGMATNSVQNRFESTGPDSTRWVIIADFKFHGIWRLLSPFFRGAINKRMLDDLSRFKTLLESGQL